MKRRNSVYNNHSSENKYSSNSKRNLSSRNGFLDTQNEFANEFFDQNLDEPRCDDQKEKKDKANESRENNTRRNNIL